jgi:DNA-damage-inducible protein J
VDERTKKEFDAFCDNVGLNAAAAVNLFIKAVVRTRVLPFPVTDASGDDRQAVMSEMKRAIQGMRKQSVQNGNAEMTLDETNAEIDAARLERRGRQ